MKKATSNDVARLAGVSQTAVSLILNESEKISFSEDTKERVFTAARKLGYSLPNRRKKEKKTPNLILVFTPTLGNPYYCDLARYVQEYAKSKGYHVILCNTFRDPELEKYYLDHLITPSVAGIVYSFLPGYAQQVEQLATSIPTVIIGEKQEDLALCSVGLNNTNAGMLLAEHLCELGHRNLAFLSTPLNRLTMARSQRLEGIRRQLAMHGEETNLEIIVSDVQEDLEQSNMPHEYLVGKRLTEQFLEQDHKATALIGVNDMMALGILNTLTEAGFRVPEDYSVCAFDNIFAASLTKPGLTTIEHHLRLLCHAAVDMLIKQDSPSRIIPGEEMGMALVKKIEYSPRLLVRGSTGPVK